MNNKLGWKLIKNNLRRKEASVFSLMLDKNFVFVRNVVQGVAQGDFSSTLKILPHCSPKNIAFWHNYKKEQMCEAYLSQKQPVGTPLHHLTHIEQLHL